MRLHGQGRRDSGREEGYALAALLVGLAIMAVMLTAAIPVWSTAARREREAELVWRGTQYARAVSLFRRKYANASPPTVDILVNERFLRRKYKDPMTKNGEFQLVYAADQQQRAGQIGVTPSPQSPGGQPGSAPTSSPSLDPQSRMTAGVRGGIIGVVSKSTDRSIRMFNGRTKYNEWQFTPETVGIRVPGGAGQPGNVPGGPAGTVGPGGRRTTTPAAPGRSPVGLDGFGRSSPMQPGQTGQSTPRPSGPPTRPPD